MILNLVHVSSVVVFSMFSEYIKYTCEHLHQRTEERHGSFTEKYSQEKYLGNVHQV